MFRRFLILSCCLFGMTGAAGAQTPETRSSLYVQNNAILFPNGVGAITASLLNTLIGNIIASAANQADANIFLGSFEVIQNANGGASLGSFLDPILNGGNIVYIGIGTAATTNNLGQLEFDYVGAGSSSNAVGISFDGGTENLVVQAGGNVLFPNIPTSGGSQYACFNSSNQLVRQAGAC